MSIAVVENKTQSVVPVTTATPPTPVSAPQPQAAVIPCSLFNVDLFVNTPEISQAFGVKAILSKEGAVVGAHMGIGKRKEMAKEFGLVGKDNADALDAKIRDTKLDAWKRVKMWLVAQPDTLIGLHSLKTRDTKSNRRHTLTIDELPEKVAATIEKYAAAHGLTMEELAELVLKARKGTVEIETTVTGTNKPIEIKK